MIPRRIHYCWFGKKELSKNALECIDSWKNMMPGVEIIQWNEDNFDVEQFDYTKEAYENKKYAFVSDVARLFVIYTYGGIYLDVDVKMIKSFDSFLEDYAFMGFQTQALDGNFYVNTGIGFGAEERNEIIGEMLQDYQNRHFVKNDGTLDLLSCPIRNSKIVEKYGVVLDGKKQMVKKTIIYPPSYFCPMNERTGKIEIKNNTYSIHLFDGSWLSKDKLIKRKIRILLGPRISGIIRKILNKGN